MRKEQINDTDIDTDYKSFRHVPALPEKETDRRRNPREPRGGDSVGSIIIGSRDNGTEVYQGDGRGDPGIVVGPQRRRENLKSDMVTEPQRRRRSPDFHMNMESQRKRAGMDSDLKMEGQGRNTDVKSDAVLETRRRRNHPESGLNIEFRRRSSNAESGADTDFQSQEEKAKTGMDMDFQSQRREAKTGMDMDFQRQRSRGLGDKRRARGSYPQQSSYNKIRRSGKEDRISTMIGSEDGDDGKKERKIITLRPDKGVGRKKNGGRRTSLLALVLVFVLGVAAGLGGGYYLWGWERPYEVDLKAAEVPDWVTQDFIRKNIFSRPDVSRKRVNNIVIHYVANPGSTAQMNRNYFDGLANQDPESGGASASSHFIVGLEGEVIQCIPITEIAYANAPRNDDTISIEVCHPDESGKFNDDTYESLVNLTAWLCRELKLSPRDVIRHYDVNEKECPKYFVEHEDAWRQFLKDVKREMQ